MSTLAERVAHDTWETIDLFSDDMYPPVASQETITNTVATVLESCTPHDTDLLFDSLEYGDVVSGFATWFLDADDSVFTGIPDPGLASHIQQALRGQSAVRFHHKHLSDPMSWSS